MLNKYLIYELISHYDYINKWSFFIHSKRMKLSNEVVLAGNFCTQEKYKLF